MYYYNLGFLPTYVGYCPNKKSWKKEMERLGIKDEPYPETHGRCTRFIKDSDHTVIICINPREETTEVQVVGLIAHEASHAVDYICEDIGEVSPSSEFKAYLTQFITQNVYENWKNESKKS